MTKKMYDTISFNDIQHNRRPNSTDTTSPQSNRKTCSSSSGSGVVASWRRQHILPPLQHNWICYSFSIIFITTTLSSLVAFAKCDQLLSGPALGVIVSQRSRRSSSIVFEDANANANANENYSHSQPSESEGEMSRMPTSISSPRRKRRRASQQFYHHTLDRNGANSDALTSLNLVNDEQREDICKEHCTCSRTKSAFVDISCDFQTNRKLNAVFGAHFRVPSDANSITIKLAASTSFRLERGFFNANKVNSLTIEGVSSRNEQVEITSDAFQGNLGPYPDILIKNIFSVIVRSKAFSANGKLTVRNCNDLIIYPDAFENAQINGLFVNIKDLRIFEKAFNSAQAKLRIESSRIENLYRFEASLREIRFVNCSIGTINGGTFDVININSIVFEGCRIDAIKARAITEKLYSKHVSITGAIIGSIESEAIYGSGIAELILTKNKIDTIQGNAIYVTAINATIAQNNIKRLENNWLRVKDWSNIIIEKNQFGIFGNMVLEETKLPVTCHFDGNSLTKPLPGSLNITNRYCILREISVNLPCRCNLDWLEALSSHDLRSETYCTIDDKLGNCFNSTTFNTLKYLIEVCDEAKTTIDCVANMNLKKIDGRFFTPEELASDNELVFKLIYVISGCVLLCVLLVLLILLIYRCLCQKPKNSSNSGTLPHVSNHLHEFTNEDLRIVQQTMQIIQKKYPEIHKKVNEKTQILLQQNLSDKKCVKTISQILDLLSNALNESSDFIAFNQVLTQHLQPPLPAASAPTPALTDPIYSEPTLRDIDGDGFYTSSTIDPMPADAYVAQGQTNLPEHIYAEPNCAQQPLLRNEYASPADRNLDSLDVYTEPINNRDGAPPTISPYSVGTAIQPRIPQYALPPARNQATRLLPKPSNEANSTTTVPPLPDVLNRHQSNSQNTFQRNQERTAAAGKPLTNVKKIAQDLQSMPKFQMNLSLNRPQNQHLVAAPVYSASGITANPMRRQVFDVPPYSASPMRDEDFELDMRGAAALPLSATPKNSNNHQVDCHSDHSGGSNETVEIDDIIEYADA